MGLEGRELLRPELFGFFQPPEKVQNRFRRKTIDTNPGIKVRMAFLDQTGLLKGAEMAAHGRR